MLGVGYAFEIGDVGDGFMVRILLNIDVPDIESAIAFYGAALGLRVRRRFDDAFVELAGAEIPIYLLRKTQGSMIGPAGGDLRDYNRHWSPIHMDIVVEDLVKAVEDATRAGAIQEGETLEEPYGRLAMFADPYGHGFCLIEFNDLGYEALLTSDQTAGN